MTAIDSTKRCAARFRLSATLTSLLLLLATATPAQMPDRIDIPTQAQSFRFYVDALAEGDDDGTSWENAFTSLQDALQTARDLDDFDQVELWVARGVYFPDRGTGLTLGNRDLAFTLVNRVAVYGGFVGSETELSERDWESNLTILSGDIDGNDAVNADGITEHYSDQVGNNSFHVVRAFGVHGSARLDGFVVTGGNASGTSGANPIDGVFDRRDGGGVHVRDAYPSLHNLVVQGNRASAVSGIGGGVNLHAGGSITLPGVPMNGIVVRGNNARWGGGIGASRLPFVIKDCRVEDNDAPTGGGLYVWLTVFEMQDCRITGNHATLAGSGGGGLYSFRGRASIVNSVFSGNRAEGDGGGLWIDPITLSLVYVLTNITLSGNHAAGLGGAIYHHQADWGSNYVNNAIIWNNSDSSGTGTPGSSHGGPGAGRIIASHSLVQGLNPPGEGNLDGTDPDNDPLFFTPVGPENAPISGGNLRVSIDSPTIDRGDNQARISMIFGTSIPHVPLQGNLLFDLHGNERIVDALGSGDPTVDLGPWEHQGGTPRRIGGLVSGLNGTGLVLRNNGGDDLAILSDGAFEFDTPIPEGHSYNVSVYSMPVDPLQLCTVSNGQAVVEDTDVTDIAVECSDRSDLLFSDRYES
jgi:predicted outer membrane repeat protein